MSNIAFSTPEIRLLTLTLASLTAIPLIYSLWPTKPRSSNAYIHTFERLIESYSTLRPQALTTHAARDFTHQIIPLSLNIPPRKLQPFQEHADQIFSLFSSFNMIPQANRTGDLIYFSPGTNTVIAHCKMGGKVNRESEMGAKLGLEKWWTECVLLVRMSADGKKVV
ncbi:hypothetical protein EK21DRAFT_84864 [Setomelanomma holmii]|uniref:Uncharacterized protein n=1 Tax=Setomelanomma holmii TaxID=210430 RepID=A0A9P4HKL6_9PLEO|nr:hypothetical protein EK21DRAFT_84864 [Setomelanomma holmii]